MKAIIMQYVHRAMVHLGGAIVAGIVTATAALGQNMTGSEKISETLEAFAIELRVAAACHLGTTPVFGIWPLSGDTIPVSDASAARIYSAILAEISQRKPGCAKFMDAAGASVVLRHLIEHGTYRVPGEDPRGEMDAGFRNADYFIQLDLQDIGNTVQAERKLTTRDGALLAGMPPFPVPSALVENGCGDGAVPLDTAIVRGAKRLVDDAPAMRVLVNKSGGDEGGADTSGFAAFTGRLLVDAIVQEGLDHVNGKRIALAQDAVADDDVYELDLRYWLCGGDRLILSARLRNGAGVTAS